MINERYKLIKKDPELKNLDKGEDEKEKKAKKDARKQIIEEQAKARKYWFGGKIEECRSLIKDLLKEINHQKSEAISANDENVDENSNSFIEHDQI